MKARAANARPLRRFAMLPAVNSLIRKRERSRTGYFALRSKRTNEAIRMMLRESRIIDNGFVTLPIVRPRRRRVMELEKVKAPGRSNFSPCAGFEISLSRFRDQ